MKQEPHADQFTRYGAGAADLARGSSKREYTKKTDGQSGDDQIALSPPFRKRGCFRVGEFYVSEPSSCPQHSTSTEPVRPQRVVTGSGIYCPA